MCYFNSLDKFYKSHMGAVPVNKEIKFRVKGNFDSAFMLIQKDGENFDNRVEMIKDGDTFSCSIKFDKGLYFYCFYVGKNIFIGQNEDFYGELTYNPTRFQLSAYEKKYNYPNWINGGIIYQIFPDRFYSFDNKKTIESGKILHENWNETPYLLPNEKGKVLNNDFFGGDLKGITLKLPYLKDLGVSVIYLNPIFKAYSNHRYDTGDYFQIDSLLGNEKDLKNLIIKADELDIKIILDGVFNHTGDDSVYFNKYGHYNSIGAYQSKESKYYSWYNFIEYPNKYDAWWGIDVLPAVNESNSDYVDFISGKNGVIDHYTKLGIAGWRLDVVDELPSEFVKKITKATKNVNKNSIVIGEVWEDASNKIAYGKRREYFLGEELDSVMNYPLKDAIINFVKNGDAKLLSRTIKSQLDHYPKHVLDSLMNILSTHDTSRLITAISGATMDGKSKEEMSKTFIPEDKLKLAKKKVKIASLLQYSIFGVPSVYYGDEIGMQGYIDPLNRRTYDWENQDLELLYHYKFLGKMRSEYSAFKNGKFIEVCADKGMFAFIRKDRNCELLIAVNVGDVSTLEFSGTLTDLITNVEYENSVILNKNDYVVLIKKL